MNKYIILLGVSMISLLISTLFVLPNLNGIIRRIKILGKENLIREFCLEKGFSDFDVSGFKTDYMDKDGNILDYVCTNPITQEIDEDTEFTEVTLEKGDVITISPSFKGFTLEEIENYEVSK